MSLLPAFLPVPAPLSPISGALPSALPEPFLASLPAWGLPLALGGFALSTLVLAWRLRRQGGQLGRRNASLEQAEARLRSVIENMPVMMNAVDESGRFVVWNKECERVTGYSAEEILHNPRALELLYPDQEAFQELMREVEARGGEYERWERTYVAKDGRVKTIERSNISRRFPVPGWKHWGVGVDVTGRIEAEREREELGDQLRHAQKLEAVGQLASGVAHEFKNLLAVMQLQARRLRERPTTEDERVRTADALERAVNQAAGATRALLTFSREFSTEKRPLDLVALVREVGRDLALSLPRSFEVRLEPAASSPAASSTELGGGAWIEADPSQLRQVLLNCALNARDESPGGGVLTLSVRREGPDGGRAESELGSVVLDVTDDGPGIAPAAQARVFEPFFTTKADGEGTGLGLAVVFGIVADHGGEARVLSEPGAGATFRFRFPCVAAPADPSPRAGGRRAIALEVADRQLSRMLATSLAERGLDVRPAVGADAELGSDEPALWVVDSLARVDELRARGLAAPVLVLAERGSPPPDHDGRLRLDRGRTAVIERPFSLDSACDLALDLVSRHAPGTP